MALAMVSMAGLRGSSQAVLEGSRQSNRLIRSGNTGRTALARTGFSVRASSAETETSRRAMLGLVAAGIVSGSFVQAVGALRNGIIQIEACGTGYWIISSMQIPLAVFFTFWIKGFISFQQDNGGGMLISPILLQIGIDPQVTAATCSFMVLVSSSMSALQYLLLGITQINSALTYTAICFVASLVGFTLVQQSTLKHGRPSLIVFSVGTVMALSIVFMTNFGAIDIWSSYKSGESMGFKKPC